MASVSEMTIPEQFPISASVSPTEANGLDKARAITVKYPLGRNVDEAIAIHGKHAVFACFIKGARLVVQPEVRVQGDIQADSGEFKTLDQIQDHFTHEDGSPSFKLSDDVQLPVDDRAKAAEAWKKLGEEARRAELQRYANQMGLKLEPQQ